ncbi:5-oxoprolinase subunit C family protein [Flexivirga lutea]
MSRSLRVVRTGPSASIQDLGRPGWFSSGVGVSGAADRESLCAANRLVGNPADAAGIECVLGGLELEALSPVTVAVTGATVSVSVDGRAADHGTAIDLPRGALLGLGTAAAGLRAYVAVRGGITVPQVLGSRSRDTLAGIGPDPLVPGMVLPVGDEPAGAAEPSAAPPPGRPVVPAHAPVVLRVELGPRQDWFTEPEALFRGWWITTDAVDRIGARLTRAAGQPKLARVHDRELPTEGMPLGAIQVPPDGEPVVLLADHPITGGYPVIGCVVSEDVGRAAQARPGQQVIFRPAGAAAHRGTGLPPAIRVTGHPADDEVAAVVAALAAGS